MEILRNDEFLNDSVNQNNITRVINDTLDSGNFENDRLFPEMVIYVYVLFLSSGALVNLTHSVALFRCKRNGTLSLILQLSSVDLLTPYVAITEVLTLYNKTWNFSPQSCMVYKGMEILINTLIFHLILCLNFHVISLWNLQKTENEASTKNPLTSCGEENSNECLVTKNENRQITIDYRKRKNDVSVVFPSILIWFISLSLSLPNFTLSSIIKMKNNYSICTIIDNYYGFLYDLLLITRLALPMLLLFISLIILISKLAKTSKKDIDNVLTKKSSETRALLTFCITLTTLYMLTSFQRYIIHILQVLSQSDVSMKPALVLSDSYLNGYSSGYLSMLHYSSSCVRAALSLFLLPKFKYLIKEKICSNWCQTKS